VSVSAFVLVLVLAWSPPAHAVQAPGQGGAASIGREVAVPRHLLDGEEYQVSLAELLRHGGGLFSANWTIQEGAGRPLTKGTGAPLADPSSRLDFPRNFNRVSGPDANSCAGCHNAPFGIAGGGGDIVANVFVLGQRFDFATFDPSDPMPTRGTTDESGHQVGLQTIANNRNTLGMFGSGYIEMLARQMTADLRAQRDLCAPGGTVSLASKGVSFGSLSRDASGAWITAQVQGLVAPSLATTGPGDPPNLVLRPFHQASNVVSLRQFTNNAMNHHHGIQTSERFGVGTDPDGDGFADEMTRADVTAVAVFQAAMAVPGRVIPRDPAIEEAVRTGEQRFESIGCAVCHVPSLPLDDGGWVYSEPNPYNPAGNLRPGEAPSLSVDLTSNALPQPRLRRQGSRVWVPAFTDLKLHDITSGRGDPNREPLNMNAPPGSPAFFAGNGRFLTRKLWGVANEPPYFHHGMFTTLRQAVLAHAGEAQASRQGFEALSAHEQDCLIEFLKTLQVLPPGTRHLVVDENGHPRSWNSGP
jgi:hypothetical protein